MSHAVTRYACDHCGRTYASKAAAKKHEDICFYGDAARACATCALLIAGYWDHHWLEDGRDQCDWGYCAQCTDGHDLNLSGERELRHECPFWRKRTVKGTFKFGKTFIEKPH